MGHPASCWERLGVELVEFVEPARRVGDYRLEQHPLRDSADAHAVSRETEFFGQAYSLAAAVLEELRGVGFGHGELPPLVYIVRIYRGSKFGSVVASPLLAKDARNGAPGHLKSKSFHQRSISPHIKIKIPTQAKRRLGWGTLFRGAGSRSQQQAPPCSLRSRVGMTKIMVLVVARGLRDNLCLRSPGRRWLGWLAGDRAGARLRGRFRGAFAWPGGGDRNGAWVGGCRLLPG